MISGWVCVLSCILAIFRVSSCALSVVRLRCERPRDGRPSVRGMERRFLMTGIRTSGCEASLVREEHACGRNEE